MTTFLTFTGLPSRYSTVTWDLLSGLRKYASPPLRILARYLTRLCAIWIGNGINSGVSSPASPPPHHGAVFPFSLTGDFPRHHDHTGFRQALAGDAAVGIPSQVGVQNC